jgi:hypothetical protein
MKGGWFIGDFEPSIYKTKKFKIGVKTHTKGEVMDTHNNKISNEKNY